VSTRPPRTPFEVRALMRGAPEMLASARIPVQAQRLAERARKEMSMRKTMEDMTVPTGLRLRRACAAVRAKNVAMGFKDATDEFLLTCDPQAQIVWGHVADAAAGPGTREERARAAGLLRDALEDRTGDASMARHTELWLQVVDAVAGCE
jgi:hypothetical protein